MPGGVEPRRIRSRCGLTARDARSQRSPAGTGENVSTTPAPDDRLLEPDRLGIIDDRIRAIAGRVTAGRTDAISKARAIYDYVIDHMAYDKVTPGWGNGDTLRACTLGKGNCTDFSAVHFTCSGRRNPGPIQDGLPDPRCATRGADRWIPLLDGILVAWHRLGAGGCFGGLEEPDRRDFYFGGLDPNRIQFSLGRDVRLPGMKQDALNYFFAPYGEIDGKPVSVARTLTVAAGR